MSEIFRDCPAELSDALQATSPASRDGCTTGSRSLAHTSSAAWLCTIPLIRASPPGSRRDGRFAGRTPWAGNSGVEASLPPMSVRNRTVTVLLVEDETLVRRLMADILEDAGFRVIEAANAGMALNWLEGGEDVQVLFTDVHMPPGIDGLELARRVHERWPEVRLVITSGLARPSAEEIAGHGTFLPKPCRPERVVQAIEQAVTGAAPSA